MILDHPETNTGFFLEAFTKMYVDSQAMGVRRQAETGSTEVISLGRLLTQIRDHPGAVDRQRYLSHWDIAEEADPIRAAMILRIAHKQFDDLAGPGETTVPAASIQADVDRLEDVGGHIGQYASRVIAHLDRRKVEHVPKFDDLDAALDLLGDIVKKCYWLVRADGLAAVAPAVQGDWTAPFREPLA
jgi:hypothetical protein